MTATVIGAQAQKLNPWGLVYDGALTENVVGEMQIRPVTYMVDGISVSAPVSCLLDLMMWDATDRMALITQPLLMMTGEKSDSRYMTEEAMEKAIGTQEKEMFVVPGASHIKTYYEPTFVEQERAKVVAFFDKYLK